MIGARTYNAAISLFKRFHERAPKRGEIMSLCAPDGEEVIALDVGELIAVVYKTREESKPYFHWFGRSENGREAKTPKPRILITSDGRQICILGGRYKFTDRGFIG